MYRTQKDFYKYSIGNPIWLYNLIAPLLPVNYICCSADNNYNFNIKGIVQRKLTGVESGINR
jgi:hypothetical protein